MIVPDEFSADGIRAALMLTRRAAESQFSLAYDLIARLPAVHAAMHAGLVDEPRARVLSEWTTELSVEQARAVCDALLSRMSTLTTGQLIEQIKKMALAIDPAWAQRRYEQAVAQRKVVGYRNPDGSANLSGYHLPVDRVAATCGRIDAVAKVKRAGDARPIDHIRAEPVPRHHRRHLHRPRRRRHPGAASRIECSDSRPLAAMLVNARCPAI